MKRKKYESFKEWFNHLLECNPDLDWKSMDENILRELKAVYEDMVEGKTEGS